jgi:hypothetical protein
LTTGIDDDLVNKSATIWEEEESEVSDSTASETVNRDELSISSNSPAQTRTPVKIAACICCMENFDETVLATVPCRDKYCRDCLQETFTRAFKNEELFPRCCRQPFTLERISNLLTSEIETEFAAKTIEYGTKNRVYCSNLRCSIFLPPALAATGSQWVVCPACQTQTCLQCKRSFHEKVECPEDEQTGEVMATAEAEGWARCPDCKPVVDLLQGCFHITYPPSTFLFPIPLHPMFTSNEELQKDALAKHNSAIYATPRPGRTANVHNGTRTDSSSKHIILLLHRTALPGAQLYLSCGMLYKSPILSTDAITAPTIVSVASMEVIDAGCAMIRRRSLLTAVGNV